MSKKSDVILIIPAYNEAGNIERVVDELILGYPQFDYVVVTDGPTDGTDEICRRRGYNAVYLPENMGLTKCFHHGMQYAWKNGYDYAIQFDGDGQHRPEYIGTMVKKAKEGYDLVQGSRFLPLSDEISFQTAQAAQQTQAVQAAQAAQTTPKAQITQTAKTAQLPMKGFRLFGSRLLRAAIYLKTGVHASDPTCGLRLYSRRIIDDFANTHLYAPEPDTIAHLLKEGVRYAEVPVHVEERSSGESYLKPVTAFKYMLRMLRGIWQ